MANFIKLSTINSVIFINMDLIEGMSRDDSMTSLHCSGDANSYYRVTETPEEILEAMKAAE
ncbi:hypothetical protein [Aggregatibacter actinomycetemcomitans]|uniref:Uncharacterized protein n=1 Tax=Aggregatibacter actinomycetemcomitans TaxID=714 RepID=A0A2G1DQQ9_AGGAC|nr:hypothetical protein [Aggregatibacter actinomycetemcomitans]BAS48360.1 hypothetical protein AANUM_1129 [Aggregatibacter actinomycetemcomitans NUM4039]MBN6060162.1 hypothetical protein [Aggregatibacter actinomycetemcomitans]MBN6088867.1 hypothetical protein [Aggregatibacter actinomycetemcomitans]PHO20842.1 hypothetical protein CQR80_04970 [Aggregatibacter actinomycetemcomitans]PHO22989.1 hypothetical protein CQR79_05490 [Aggregatibacter actinomycetemcomitans]